MGGVPGHMSHLYDNQDLTFSEMKEIMDAASNGDLSTEEKVDGQNIVLSYSISEGKAKGARNKGNLKQGGLDASGLAQKFAGRGTLEQAFTSGFSAFEKAVSSLSSQEKKKIFGPDTNIWYNAEIMDPSHKNVIKYDSKTLKIHGVGHFAFDRESGEKSPIPEGSLETLDSSLDKMQKALHGEDYSLARQAIIRLKKLEDDTILKEAKSKIDSELTKEGLSDKDTILDYTTSRLRNGLEASLPDNLKEELINYILKLPANVGLKAIKKGLDKEQLEDVRTILVSKKMLLEEAIQPIESIVHDFTVEILKGLQSVFIKDTEAEVKRLKDDLATAVNDITERGPDDPQAMDIMQRHLNKIKDFSQITTPVEAVVFDYNGHTYKFAGNFAPLNQILGMFRYARADKKLNTESINFDTQVLTEKTGKKVALLPGGFKPPHAGHYGLAKGLASNSDVDEVIVIIGKNPRFSDIEPKITITAEQSKNLWDLYTRNDNNIKVRIQEGKTPVADVYDLIADKNSFSDGDTVFLGKSDKDQGDTRFARAQSYAERHNPGVNVKEIVFPVIGGESMGGTALRDMIAAGEKERFISKLPTHLSSDELEEVWNSVTTRNENLNSFIDKTIEEMSAMGAGSIQGASGLNGFGPTNKYNPYKRSKTSKPKVRRAKRQRRR
tara:strand:+ start:8193 stop:10190 length:1998 start_codon:yes stop_codon:yes gene_type:complete